MLTQGLHDTTVDFEVSGDQALDLLHTLAATEDGVPHVSITLCNGPNISGTVVDYEAETELRGVSPRVSGTLNLSSA